MMKKIINLLIIICIFASTACKATFAAETEVDLSDFFTGKEGCAVFYKDNDFDVYNKDMIDVQAPPCSTFKIFLTLAGLKYGVLKDENTQIKWDGVKRYFDFWNKDLTLKEAFNLSAVWCFKKIATEIGKENLTKTINEISYGNCDTSGEIPFWIDSSIKISPREQVKFISDVFEFKLSFSKEHVDMLKTIMNKGTINGGNLYGKTGTSGENKNGWFVGAYEKDNKYLFFALRLYGGDEVSGPVAEKVLRKIIENKY